MPGRSTKDRDAKPTPRNGYARLSSRPLHILAFLMPLIAVYEFGSFRYLADSDRG